MEHLVASWLAVETEAAHRGQSRFAYRKEALCLGVGGACSGLEGAGAAACSAEVGVEVALRPAKRQKKGKGGMRVGGGMGGGGR